MLIVVSDLHFSDKSVGGQYPPESAFREVFLGDIVGAIGKDPSTVKKITLLLLGDVFDLLRSNKWFEMDGKAFPADDRPWGKNGLLDIPSPRRQSNTLKRCLDILLGPSPHSHPAAWTKDKPDAVPDDTILGANWGTLKFFREFETELKKALPKGFADTQVEKIYVVGNHDRMVDLYPELRDQARNILGISSALEVDNGPPVNGEDWWFKTEFSSSRHKVFTRHGHQFDPVNFGKNARLNRDGHTRPAIGDVITTEFVTKLPWLFAKKLGDPQTPKAVKEGAQWVVEALKMMDDLRPASAALEWFRYHMNNWQSGEASEIMKKTLDQVEKEFFDLEFVNSLKTNSNLWLYLAAKASLVVRWVSMHFAWDIVSKLLQMNDRGSEAYENGAFNDLHALVGRQYVLYGHTHIPMVKPLDRIGTDSCLYCNTGTFRNSVVRTVDADRPPEFIQLSGMSYATLTVRNNGKVQCDVWMGNRNPVG